MKKLLRGITALAVAMTLSTGVVEAYTQSRSIDTNKCETVYTNYYFLLDAMPVSFFNKAPLNTLTRNTVGNYHNNSYLTNNLDESNIGYGQVNVSRSTSSSRDGISSMSMEDYYTYYLKAMNRSNGTYTDGNKRFIVDHDWYSADWEHKTNGLDLRDYNKYNLMDASLNANASITRMHNISAINTDPFDLKIDRNYYGSLTGLPIQYGTTEYYLHPAVYYVQYCEAKREEAPSEFKIEYFGNGDNVSNIPSTQYGYNNECKRISAGPTRPGYEFQGWSVRSDSTIVDYRAGIDDYCGAVGNIRLYAVWKKIETPVETYYTVYYRPGTTDAVYNMPADTTVNTNSDVYIANNTPTRAGYKFIGWTTDSNNVTANPSYNGGALYKDRKDITLYAVWQKVDTPVLPENPKTGIEDYLLPFGGVVGASGLALNVLKKKKGFKQF